jgi:hypothetical protein
MDGRPPREGDLGDGGVDALLVAFARWAADEQVAESGRQRSRERWLRHQASGSATLTGVLTDLAEARPAVALATPARRWTGTMVGVGRDFCVLEDHGGGAILVATASVTTVSTTDRGRHPGEPGGDRSAPLGLRLIDALGVLAGLRHPVRLSLGPDDHVAGDLTAVGIDVVTLRVDRPARTVVHVPLARIQACQPR